MYIVNDYTICAIKKKRQILTGQIRIKFANKGDKTVIKKKKKLATFEYR